MKEHFIKLKRILFFLVLTTSIFSSKAQVSLTSELEAEKARQELEDKGIAEDEVKARLKAKGIDLDNLRPEQIATLDEEIKLVVSEIEGEKSDTSKSFEDATTTLSEGLDSLLESELKETVGDDISEISEDISDGASLEEALSNDLSKKLSEKYGVKTDIFGHHIFFDKSIDLFRTTSSSTTPNSYVLDVGDKIAINIFGASQADLLYEIEEDGFIRPSGMYKIYLKGVTIAKAKVLLKNRFRQAFMFQDGQFNVDLHTARTITVNLFGEVNQPGSYTISALNTALNALIAAGGITREAGIRNIRIISNGKERVLDVYDFVANPKVMYDYFLHDNDIIYVSKWNKLVSAKGAGFKTQGRFELLENENMEDLLGYTQGLHSKAYTSVVRYTTYNGEEQVLKNYTLDQLLSEKIVFQDGDEVFINTSSIAYENFVQVNGAVRHPGRYEFNEGDKVSDVLDIAFLEEETFSKLAYLRRKNTDGTFKLIRLYIDDILSDPKSIKNIALEKEDVITLYGKSSFVDSYTFNIAGAVRSPNEYFYDSEDNITVYDAIMMSKGLNANATDFGYIIGAPTDNSLERNYTVINIAEIIADPSSPANVKIKAKDSIVIPSKEQYMEQFTVKIGGAVKNPGEYVYDASLSVKEMLIMAGGLKLEAATNKVDVFRLNINENEATKTTSTTLVLDRSLNPFTESSDFVLQPYDQIVVRSTPEYEPIKYVNINGEVRYPGLYAVMEDNETISSLVERAGGITKEGFPEAASFYRNQDGIGNVVTRVDKAIAGKTKYDISLKQGDEISIPKLIDIVKIDRFGTNADEVYSTRTMGGTDTSGPLNLVVNYRNKGAKWYIKEFAGGFDNGVVKRTKTKVIHANGQTKKTVSLGIVNIYPKVRRGSEIVLAPNKKYLKRIEEQERREQGIYVPEKEKITFMERMRTLQAIITIASTTMTTTITSILLVKELQK